jgi:Tfp pilus assembly protein PilV
MRLNMRARPALTVVEVLVALVLVSVGLLGMAGTSALWLRTATTAAREWSATRRAESRLAILAAAGCERASSGALEAPGVREQWSVAPPRAGIAFVEARVDWLGSRSQRRTVLLRSALLC